MFHVLRAEGCFCSLDVLYGGLGICKLQCLIKKKFFGCKFFPILVIIALDLDPHLNQCGSETCLKHVYEYSRKKSLASYFPFNYVNCGTVLFENQ
jgi:hypothetical protein